MTAVLAPAGVRHGGRSVARPQLARSSVVLAQVGLWLLPVLRPAGPVGLALPDLALVPCTVLTLVHARRSRERVRVPYAWGVALMVTGGAVAMAVAGPFRDPQGWMALLQDCYLLAWAAALAHLGSDPGTLRRVMRTWAAAAVAHAVLFDVSWFGGLVVLSGSGGREGTRGSYLLGDPNLAANYFAVGLYVLLACDLGGRRGRRALLASPLLLAVVLTGSNGGLLALGVSGGLAAVLAIRRRSGAVAALATACLIGVTAFGLVRAAPLQQVQDWATRTGGIAQDSVGRSADSGQSRDTLLSESTRLWWEHGVVGIGPGATKRMLAAEQAAYVKEAHDDYLATLVERGFVGAVGLLVLLAAAATRSVTVVTAPPGSRAATAVPRPHWLVAAGVVMLVAAGVYETLHFRQTWTLLGLIAAVAALSGGRAER